MNRPGMLTCAAALASQGGPVPNPQPATISLMRGMSGYDPDPSASTVILASGSRSATSPAYSGAAIAPALSPTTTTSDAPGAAAATKSAAAVPFTNPLWWTVTPGAYSVVMLP